MTLASHADELRCANCRAPRHGEYCSDCGQSHRLGRITFRGLIGELVERFLNLERGFPRTVRDLTLRPGAMMREYVAGRRKMYVHPFTYLLLGATAYFLASEWSGAHEVARSFSGGFADGAGASAATTRHSARALELLFENGAYLMLGAAFLLSGVLFLFFPKAGFNRSEISIFSLYLFGHVALLSALLALVLSLLDDHVVYVAMIRWGLTIGLAAWAARGFFGRGFGRAAKAVAGVLVSYLCALVVGFAVIYLVISSGAFDDSTRAKTERWTLDEAVETGTYGRVRSLIEQGWDPNQAIHHTVLHLAAEQGDEEMVATLLEAGADPTVEDHLGRTPLELATDPETRDRLREAMTADGAPREDPDGP